MNNAIFSMAEAKFAMGDFNQMVLTRADKAQLKAKAKKENVAGFLSMSSFDAIVLYSCLCGILHTRQWMQCLSGITGICHVRSDRETP